MPVIGSPRSFFKKFAFTVEIDSMVVFKFTKAGPIEFEIAEVEQHEGGSLIPVKEPGRVKVTNFVLEQGVTTSKELWNWAKDVVNLAAQTGKVSPRYKRNLDVVQRDRDGTELERWRLSGAWPSKVNMGTWDNTVDENVVQMLTLTYDFPDQVPAAV